MSFHDEIRKAIGVHGVWKTRLMNAIEAGKSEFVPDQVCKDNVCEFGKWLYGTTIPPDIKKSAEFETCRRLHADFHLAAADVLRLAVSGKKAQALAAIAPATKYANVSSDLTRTLSKWARSLH
jgi:chemoreceptor zinc-binding protein